MQPHASSPLSFAHTRSEDLEKEATPALSPQDRSRFGEAFAKASRTPPTALPVGLSPAKSPSDLARATPERSGRKAPSEATPSTARRPERRERQRADAGTEARPEVERAVEARGDETAARPVDDAHATEGANEAERSERTRAETVAARADLLAFLQVAPTAITLPQGALTLGAPAPGAGLEGETAGSPEAASSVTKGFDAGSLAETGHTSEATLNHLADAFARADRLHERGTAAALEGEGTLDTTGMQLSSEAHALLEGRPGERASAQALANGNGLAAKVETNGKAAAQEGAKSLDASATEGTISATSAAGASTGRAGARSQQSFEGDREGSSRGDERLARDAFTAATRPGDDLAPGTTVHGAFGADPRVQGALEGKASPEARLEQAKAASEHILERIERITEQRSAGREMVIATERGPVRVRVDIAEKNVSVQFRAEDDQLKAMLRSGLPALQATLAKRGFASTDFQFDGDGANDLMASGGGSKHAEARALRETLLGEAMIEPVVLEGPKASKNDPRALLSVTA